MKKHFVSVIWIAIACLSSVSSEGLHQDSRCICKCPDPATAFSKTNGTGNTRKLEFLDQTPSVRGDSGDGTRGTDKRSVYVNSLVTPEDCDCKHVVIPHLPNITETEKDAFCPRCSCKFQTRSLTIIKVVVILVIWVISILVIYMGFLSCLDPILNKRAILRTSQSVTYREHHDERTSDDEGSGGERAQDGSSSGTQMRTYGSAEAVINRLGNQQTRWKKQVQEQRRNIYDRHAMLN